jgi:hypothetical protein
VGLRSFRRLLLGFCRGGLCRGGLCRGGLCRGGLLGHRLLFRLCRNVLVLGRCLFGSRLRLAVAAGRRCGLLLLVERGNLVALRPSVLVPRAELTDARRRLCIVGILLPEHEVRLLVYNLGVQSRPGKGLLVPLTFQKLLHPVLGHVQFPNHAE